MKKLNQKGFGLVEGLLILIAVTLIGFVGYYIYHTQKQADKNLTIPSTSNTVSNKTSSSSKAQENYLTIKEWGVRIALSATSEGAYYKQRDSDQTSPPTFIDVFSIKSDSLVGPKGVTCKGEYIALLLRLPKNDPNWQDPQYVGASLAQKDIGDYKYNLATKKQYGP